MKNAPMTVLKNRYILTRNIHSEIGLPEVRSILAISTENALICDIVKIRHLFSHELYKTHDQNTKYLNIT
jgi:hypothetical protein